MTATARSAFLAQRRVGLGGSDVAAVLGLPGAYRTAYQVWLDKTGQADDDERGPASDLLGLGNLLESAVLTWGAADVGATLRPGEFVRRDWMVGNPDGMLGDEGVEGKVLVHGDATVRALQWEMQCRWYMALTGAGRWHLVSLELPRRVPVETVAALVRADGPGEQLAVIEGVKGASFHRRAFVRDLEVERVMIARCAAWWQRHVVGGEAPPVDGSDETRRHLARWHADPSEAWLQDDGDLGELVAAYEAFREAERTAKARKDEVAARLQAAIGDHAGARGSWGSVRWSRFERSSLDHKQLRIDRPDLAPVLDAYTRRTPTGRLYPNLKD